MITIKVVYSSSGKPAKSVRVSLGFSSLFRGVTDTEYTDDNGEAHFDNDPGDGAVYVNGSTEYEGDLRGRVVVYI